MKKNIEPLQPDTFYHIFNRGINGENIFKEERNYPFFLEKYAKYIPPVAETYAYCLLKNHFHLLVKTKTEEEIRNNLNNREEDKEGFARSEALPQKHTDKPISWIISNGFSSLFKSYALAIKKAHNRTGGLFEDPFRRIAIEMILTSPVSSHTFITIPKNTVSWMISGTTHTRVITVI